MNQVCNVRVKIRQINNYGSVATQTCPKGYCCSTTKCLFDPYNQLNQPSPKLLCGNYTNRDWLTPLCGNCLNGYSETLSPIGECLNCNDDSNNNFFYIYYYYQIYLVYV